MLSTFLKKKPRGLRLLHLFARETLANALAYCLKCKKPERVTTYPLVSNPLVSLFYRFRVVSRLFQPWQPHS